MNDELIGRVKAALEYMKNGHYMHAQFTLKAAMDRLPQQAVKEALAEPYMLMEAKQEKQQ